jgi:hypothetical protein
MNNKRKTIPILFNGGAYGSFIEWCLLYFSGQTDTIDPTGMNGSSHNFAGRHLMNMDGWRNYLSDQTVSVSPLVRFHPKVTKQESAISNILEVSNSTDRTILLYAGYDSLLLNINNKFEKIWEEGWLTKTEHDFKYNLKSWGRYNLTDMTRWELREFLSFFIIPQHLSESEMDSILGYSSPNVIKVDVRDIINNFKKTITLLLEWCQFEIKRYDFDRVFAMWIEKQVHIHKDQLVIDIVQSILSNNNINWSHARLTIVDESIIQMRLRDLYNLDLRCYNLNVFPTNTKDLKELLIDVKPV